MQKQLEQWFVSFIRDHKTQCYLLSYSYVKNEQDALDIVQESIHKAWKSLYQINDPTQFKRWFYQIIVHTAIDFLRKQKHVQLVDNESLEYYSTGQIDTYEDIDMQGLLEQLPLKYKEVIILRYFEDLKLEDVAHVIGIPVSTAKSRLYKALELLKIQLQGEEL